MSYAPSIAGKLLQMAEKTRPVCAAVNGAKVTCGGDTFTVNDALEAPMALQAQPETTVTVYGKNLADISLIGYNESKSYVQYVNDTVLVQGSRTATTGLGCGLTLQQLVPGLQVGQVYFLQGASELANRNYIYLQGYNRSWWFGQAMTITEEMAGSKVYFYTDMGKDNVISQLQITLGSAASDYEPYRQPKTADAGGQVITAYKNMTVVGTQVQCSYFPQSAAGIYGKYTDIKAAQEKLKEELNV